MTDDGYDTELIEDLQFTESQIDMMFFACLSYLGHPQAEGYEMLDGGYDDLLAALTKIQAYFGDREVSGEPSVVTPL